MKCLQEAIILELRIGGKWDEALYQPERFSTKWDTGQITSFRPFSGHRWPMFIFSTLNEVAKIIMVS